MLPKGVNDLWSLVHGRPHIDAWDLAEAIQDEASQPSLDYRTRLLIRDSILALRGHWGEPRLRNWLENSPVRTRIEEIIREDFERPGFPSLGERIMEKTDPEAVKQFLRELGMQIHRPLRVDVGRSVALILPGFLVRPTDDVDVVDEIPAELRALHRQLAALKKRYGLKLAHFQSHHLPDGWSNRLHSLGSFGQLRVFLVDVYDVVLSKLFSARTKDRDDLRMVLPLLDKDTVVRKIRETTTALRSDAKLLKSAEDNWYILYGETLPS